MYPVQIMIAGAQKAGTSSLTGYLSQHPGICTHPQLEMMYFAVDDIYAQGYERAFQRYFSHRINHQKVILAKNVGIMYLPKATRRLQEHNPSIQVIIVLRHPVDRAYSAYWYARRMGWENLKTFEEAISADPSRFENDPEPKRIGSYLDRSLYAKHIQQMLNIFPVEQLHIYLLEDLQANPESICQGIFKRLEIDESFVPNTEYSKNKAAQPRDGRINWVFSSPHPIPGTVRRIVRILFPDRVGDILKIRLRKTIEREFLPPKMDPETRRKLLDYFCPYNEELSGLLDRDLSSWCK